MSAEDERPEDAPEGKEEQAAPEPESGAGEEAGTEEEQATPELVGEEQSAEEQPEGAEGPPAAEGEVAGEPAAEEPAAEAAEAETEPEPEPSAPEEPEEPSVPPAADVRAVVPGADLEPIAIEAEENLSAEERARREAEAEEERARREAELAAEQAPEEAPAREPAKLETDARFHATGKRKNAVARVLVSSGGGAVQVNGRDLAEYFPRPAHQTMVKQPLVTSGYESAVDVRIRAHGGGIGGQAAAARHGLARALTEIDPELRGDLKRRGYLTRDSRAKERRKAGLKKARKRPQFSKR